MSIEELCKILRPPANPKEVPSPTELSTVEQEYSPLPDAYKEFIGLYGTGCIDGFIWIYNPTTNNSNLSMKDQIPRQLDAIRNALQDDGRLPYDVSERSRELLPFGMTDNGDFLLWRTVGSPNAWSIVVLESRLGAYEEFALSIVEFLVQVLSRKLRVSIFPDDFPSSKPQFLPVAD
ncbi:MAG: SMI1/KNR4 family protein [Phycisphaerae bacterium]|nr:SMI1/KNR4 family protein [Phycisphaerae bacterium]